VDLPVLQMQKTIENDTWAAWTSGSATIKDFTSNKKPSMGQPLVT
jgi:hypothetical protein